MPEFLNGPLTGNTSAEQLESYLARVADESYERLKLARLARLEVEKQVEKQLEQVMLAEDQANAEWAKASAELNCFAKVVAEARDRQL